MVTSFLLRFAFSTPFINPSRTLLFEIFSALSKAPSNDPYALINFTAVFSPTPGTPGTLSELSPMRPSRSITLSGGTPHFSMTKCESYTLGPGDFFVPGAYKKIFSLINCMKSLSPLTI